MAMYPEQIVTSSLQEAVLHVNNCYSYYHTTATATTTNNNNNNNNNNLLNLTYILQSKVSANTTFSVVYIPYIIFLGKMPLPFFICHTSICYNSTIPHYNNPSSSSSKLYAVYFEWLSHFYFTL